MDQREKDAEKAFTRLYGVFHSQLSPDVRIELYARGILTWNENERIMEAAKFHKKEAIDELLTALRRKGAKGMDELAEILEEEEEANEKIIKSLRQKWPKQAKPESTQPPPVGVFGAGRPAHPSVSEDIKEQFPGDEEWPFERQSQPPPSQSVPPPPVEGVDTGKKDAYKMTAKPRGLAIIINNRNFTCGMKDRVGTDIDAAALTKLCNHLGFYTNRYDNLKGVDFRKHLQDVADINHSRFDCLIVAILSHGVDGKLYSTDGELIPVRDITSYFDGNNCPSLIGKPKVFILQACRGGRFDYGVVMEGTDSADDKPVPEEQVKQLMEQQFDTIIEKTLEEKDKSALGDETDGGGYDKSALPAEADYIIAYATLPGYVSWRNSEYGSWFIKAFTDTMFESAKNEHFLDILTQVNARVAEEFQSKGKNKQMPAPVTMLRRKLFFRPGSYK